MLRCHCVRWRQIVFRQQEGKWPTPRERCFNSPARAKAVCGGARFRTNFFCVHHDEHLVSLSLSLSLSTEPRSCVAVHGFNVLWFLLNVMQKVIPSNKRNVKSVFNRVAVSLTTRMGTFGVVGSDSAITEFAYNFRL